MKIYGLARLTLLDYPGHVACTVFLSGCDFRCPYCHNYELAEGKSRPVMEEEELLAFLKKRTGLLDGVAFTGGEPCLHAGLPDLIRKVRQLGYAIKLDTNGYHPGMLKSLLAEGLVDYVAMDIKNSPEKYAWTSGLTTQGGEKAGSADFDLSVIRESIAILMQSGVEYEFRTTVVRQFHAPEDFEKMGELIRGADRYYLQCFTDRDTVPYAGFSALSEEEMHTCRDLIAAFVKKAEIRGL